MECSLFMEWTLPLPAEPDCCLLSGLKGSSRHPAHLGGWPSAEPRPPGRPRALPGASLCPNARPLWRARGACLGRSQFGSALPPTLQAGAGEQPPWWEAEGCGAGASFSGWAPSPLLGLVSMLASGQARGWPAERGPVLPRADSAGGLGGMLSAGIPMDFRNGVDRSCSHGPGCSAKHDAD